MPHLAVRIIASLLTLACITLASSKHSSIPRKVWTFWDDADHVPPFIAACIDNWKRWNPDFNITLVTAATLDKIITTRPLPRKFHDIAPQGKADWIRLALLQEHGGIWIDSSSFVTRDLKWIMDRQTDIYSGIMFYLKSWTWDERYPMLENWFLSSVPHDLFITAWLVEFERVINDFSNDGLQYAEHLISVYGEDKFAQIRQGIPVDWGVAYLTQHLAHQKIMQIDGIQHSFKLSEATEPSSPYALQEYVGKWSHSMLAKRILGDSAGREKLENPPALVKLNGMNRRFLLKYLRLPRVSVHPNSVFVRYLMANGNAEDGQLAKIRRYKYFDMH